MFDKKAWVEANREKVKLYSVRARLMSKKDDVAYSLQTLCHPASEFLADGQRLTLFIKRGNEAASEILRLRAENEKLRAALKPFAEYPTPNSASDDGGLMVLVSDLRAAAAALKETGDE